VLHALRSWLDSWPGIGAVVVGIAHQGYDLQLTRYDEQGWRATFYQRRPLSMKRGKRMSVPCRFGALRLGQPTDGNTGGTCNGLTAHLNRYSIRKGVSSKYRRTTAAASMNDH
jgi:hypothetical protein